MAVKLKSELFTSPDELCQFVKNKDLTAELIQEIVYHPNAGFYLFYWKE